MSPLDFFRSRPNPHDQELTMAYLPLRTLPPCPNVNLANEWLEQIVIAFVGAIIVVIIARIIV